MTKKIVVIIVVIGALVGGLSWMLQKEQDVSPSSANGEGKLRVVTTTTMVTDMVKIIGGDRILVEGLMGPGVDPHSYQVTFRDTAALQGADIIFYSGHHLEGKMQDVLEKRAKNHGGVFAVTDGIAEADLLKPEEEFQGYYDPHIWGDPKLWAQCLSVVVDALSEADPKGADQYKERVGLSASALLLMLYRRLTQKVLTNTKRGQRTMPVSLSLCMIGHRQGSVRSRQRKECWLLAMMPFIISVKLLRFRLEDCRGCLLILNRA